ncbi:MAG: FKBP-type peptidyl-prolyl cis-trans isomerase [Bacteroidales bacterium]|jgi:FKBP-type peptidyl-prolyl cis-trans isomerase|nr:FKBP-type peptidyl-prolyl cis-trans isomerase [Bacteroidales bacterium]
MELRNEKEKVSFIIGEDIGNSFLREGYDLDIDIMMEAMRLASEGKCPQLLKEEEKNSIMQKWQTEMQDKKQARQKQEGLKAREEGALFMKANINKEGIKQTPSGLQYEVLIEGNGKKPLASDVVNVHYHGTLLNGDVFDSSVLRNEAVSFPLNQVIKGWTEGLQLMNVGSKYKFYIPADLAYGDASVGIIPSGSTLIFEVELLDVN